MTHRIVFRPAAEQDLFDLYDYIAEDAGRGRAGAFVEWIEAACMGLAEFPERGLRRDDLVSGLRTLLFDRRVSIAYSLSDDRVDILRIFYAGRDFEPVLRDIP